jgi:hypothetical protein
MTHTNPLITKWEELHNPKKEEPKEEKYEMPPEWDVRSLTTSSVASSNTGIAKANPIPKLTSYDVDSVKDSFFQISEKVANGEARVVSMHMNMEHYKKSITFEVQVYS